MDDSSARRAAGNPAGRAAPAAPQDARNAGPDDETLAYRPGEGLHLPGALVQRSGQDRPAAGAPVRCTLTAKWALWGKDEVTPEYRVLRCSTGAFRPDDFHGIITRYASGAKETLPQYTVYWIPASGTRDRHLALGVHEQVPVDPDRSGGRVQSARGRRIEYLRLFCFSYTELENYRLGYYELAEAVADHQLPASRTGPIPIEVPVTKPAPLTGRNYALAENVAALLLTTRPVCVLGAEETTPQDRLNFIDQVMWLLPYGLRATLSASTWASPTAQELKLRLFFTSTALADDSRAQYVTWGQPGQRDFSQQIPRHYLNWLNRAGTGAATVLASQPDPVRFTPDDLRRMMTKLQGRPVSDLLEEIADCLAQGDIETVQADIQQLQNRRDGAPDPANRRDYRQKITKLQLLEDHPILDSAQGSFYRTLLNLAFNTPISYYEYCEIEDCLGRRSPHPALLRALMDFSYVDYRPLILIYRSPTGSTDRDLIMRLNQLQDSATRIFRKFQKEVQEIRPEHREPIYDLVYYYLYSQARADEDPWEELIQCGYATKTLAAVFPGDTAVQQARLRGILRFAHGVSWFTPDQAGQLLSRPDVRTTAFEAAVKQLTRPARPARPARLGAGRSGVTRQSGTVRVRWKPGPNGTVVVLRASLLALSGLAIVAVLLIAALAFYVR